MKIFTIISLLFLVSCTTVNVKNLTIKNNDDMFSQHKSLLLRDQDGISITLKKSITKVYVQNENVVDRSAFSLFIHSDNNTPVSVEYQIATKNFVLLSGKLSNKIKILPNQTLRLALLAQETSKNLQFVFIKPSSIFVTKLIIEK